MKRRTFIASTGAVAAGIAAKGARAAPSGGGFDVADNGSDQYAEPQQLFFREWIPIGAHEIAAQVRADLLQHQHGVRPIQAGHDPIEDRHWRRIVAQQHRQRGEAITDRRDIESP